MTTITIFNVRMGTNRREIVVPTTIKGVRFYTSDSMTDGSYKTGTRTVTIRIPVNAEQGGKHYIDAKQYSETADYDSVWTARTGDYFVEGDYSDANISVSEFQEKYRGRFYTVNSFADNTKRGSEYVQHYRLGGY